MYYYKFTADTIFCGTENEYFVATKEPLTAKEIDEMREEYARENAESFEYLLTGWEDDNFEDEGERDEALTNYYADAECSCEEITKDEYEEELGIK